MSAPRLRTATVAIGFVVAAGIVLLVLSLVGFRATLSAIVDADRSLFAPIFVVVSLWLFVWSYTFSTVLTTLEVDHGPLEALVLYGNVVFANSIAPSTYLGGEPLAALFVSRRTGRSYETGFAAVTSVDLLNYAPMVPLATLGLLYFATAPVVGRRTELALLAVLVVLIVFIAGLIVSWRRRERAIVRIAAFIGAISSRTSPFVPGVHPIVPERLEMRLGLFVDNVESVANDRATLWLALVYSTLGWLFLSVVLWLALLAVGHTIPPEVALFVVPLGAATNVLPLPGGVGTVESVFVVLLVAAGGVPAVSATAATLLYRVATYWFPLVVGGGTVAVTQVPVPPSID